MSDWKMLGFEVKSLRMQLDNENEWEEGYLVVDDGSSMGAILWSVTSVRHEWLVADVNGPLVTCESEEAANEKCEELSADGEEHTVHKALVLE